MNKNTLTTKQANKITAEENAKFEESGAAVVCVSAAVTSYYTVIIPTDKKEEFEAAPEDKKKKFTEISEACFSDRNLNKDFLTAWAEEYNKIY